MVQNTTTPINNAEDGIREKCLFDLKYNTSKDYQDLTMWNNLSAAALTTTGRRSNTTAVANTSTENVNINSINQDCK